MTSAEEPDSLLGTRLGSCVLEAPLGYGGMGAVYLARQERPHRQVAVKVLRAQLAADAEAWNVFLARFRREADATATLDHANIVPIYEFGEDNGMAYLVMPYLADGSLAALLARQGPLHVTRVVEYIEQAAAALDHAHSRGLVHRDVKPSNLLLHPDGRLLLADFGIARPFAGDPISDGDDADVPVSTPFEDVALTQTGAAMGTPEYMAPEQVQGEPVGPPADIYALGIVTYLLLSGRTPFGGGELMEVLRRQLLQPPYPLRALRTDVPARMEEVIFWALAKDPVDRPSTAGAFAGALRDSRRSRALSQLFGWQGSGELSAVNDRDGGAAPSSVMSIRNLTHTMPLRGGARAESDLPQVPGSEVVPMPTVPLSGNTPSSIRQSDVPPSSRQTFMPGANDATIYDVVLHQRSAAPVWPTPVRKPANRSRGLLLTTIIAAIVTFALGAAVVAGALSLGELILPDATSPGGIHATTSPSPSPTATFMPSPSATIPTDWLSVSPSSVSLGCKGGGRSKVVTLSNIGPQPLKWSAAIPSYFGSSEVNVSPSSGTVQAGDNVNITITNRPSFVPHEDSILFQPQNSIGGAAPEVQFSTPACL